GADRAALGHLVDIPYVEENGARLLHCYSLCGGDLWDRVAQLCQSTIFGLHITSSLCLCGLQGYGACPGCAGLPTLLLRAGEFLGALGASPPIIPRTYSFGTPSDSPRGLRCQGAVATAGLLPAWQTLQRGSLPRDDSRQSILTASNCS